MNRIIIAAGANIKPWYHIQLARQRLSDAFHLLKESAFIETRPVGFTDQDNFVNGAFLIDTNHSQPAVKATLRKIEDDLGRVRTWNKWGPRTIDLDIVVWNNKIIDEDVYKRDFLKQSILELLPALCDQLAQ